MLNPTLHVSLVSAQAADIGQYITLSFTTALRLQHNCLPIDAPEGDAEVIILIPYPSPPRGKGTTLVLRQSGSSSATTALLERGNRR